MSLRPNVLVGLHIGTKRAPPHTGFGGVRAIFVKVNGVSVCIWYRWCLWGCDGEDVMARVWWWWCLWGWCDGEDVMVRVWWWGCDVRVWWWGCDGEGVMVRVWWWGCDGKGVMVRMWWGCDGEGGWWGCDGENVMVRVWWWGCDGEGVSMRVWWWGSWHALTRDVGVVPGIVVHPDFCWQAPSFGSHPVLLPQCDCVQYPSNRRCEPPSPQLILHSFLIHYSQFHACLHKMKSDPIMKYM